MAEIAFVLNGREVMVTVDPGRSLLHVLREDLDLTGTKQSCDGEGECGACTVILDEQAVHACLTPIGKVAGRRVVTVEGLGTPERLHPVQQAFIDHGAVQCGFCTPGMIVSAAALLMREPDPTPEQIAEALEGTLCRCTGYARIVQAVAAAATTMRGETPSPSVDQERPIVGGSQARVDAVAKVTGVARYAEDIKLPGLLHAALVRSPLPHARVLDVDLAPALGLPGVVRVLTAADVPGLNELKGYSHDEHVLAAPGATVRMIGDAVALVIGESPAAARAGATAVRVEYEPLPATYDPAEAMEADAVLIHPGSNILSEYEIHHGHLDTALVDADAVVEARYQTSYQEHAAMERETVLAYLDDAGVLTVVAGNQEPHWARGWIAQALGLAEERVRVVTPPTGGAFGGKQDPWPLIAGALAAYHAPGSRPVRLVYTRRESFDASPKRHPYRMWYRVGARADGTLTGLRVRIVTDTGAYDSAGFYIPEYALVAGCGPYHWRAVDAVARAVYTNGPKAGQMRGYGTPQSVFALECTLDELAQRLNLDPLELRLRNAIDDQTTTFLGYPVSETIGYRECLEAIRPHYRNALARAETSPADGPWRRGVGLAGAWYRFGKTAPLTCEAHAELGLDGAIALYFAAPDYGQGSATVMAQLAAEALGCPREGLRLVNADTARTPDSGIQGASRSTYWVGGAVSQAAALLGERILSVAAEMLDCSPDLLSLTVDAVVAHARRLAGTRSPARSAGRCVRRSPLRVGTAPCPQDAVRGQPIARVDTHRELSLPGGAAVSLAAVAAEMERIGQSRRVRGVFAPDPHLPAPSHSEYLPFFAAGAQMAEVDVNVETGEVRVARVVAAHDVGRAINPQNARGQVEGAVLMGLGMALLEEYVPGATTGLSDYFLPTVRDAPVVEAILVEVPSRWGPQGAKGLGEPATVPTAPAIVNAIAHAAGIRVRRLPATPERVRAAIHGA